MNPDTHLCSYCHRSVERPCLSRASSDSCGQSISRERHGGAGERSISFDIQHIVSVDSFMDQVRHERERLQREGKDPYRGWQKEKADTAMRMEAWQRFDSWMKKTKKVRPWYEVLKIPHKGSSHEIKCVRKFRDYVKAKDYADRRMLKAEGSASFQVQTRQSCVPDRSQLIKPNQKEVVMAKAKAKAKAKKGNGSERTKKDHVKKDKAYYLRCAAGKEADCGSGDFIRGHLLQGKLTAKEIAGLVRKRFKGSTAKETDVYFNRGKLKEQRIPVPDMPKLEVA